jgi:hypothetical protein
MFIIWNFETPVTLIASCIWNFCEYFEISLGHAAPQVFGLMIRRKGNKIK